MLVLAGMPLVNLVTSFIRRYIFIDQTLFQLAIYNAKEKEKVYCRAKMLFFLSGQTGTCVGF